MFKLARAVLRPPKASHRCPYFQIRTFLSQAYYCNEVWDNRLNSPILQKVNLDVLYHELDQKFQKTWRISPVDVDIFANSVKNDVFIEEMIDLVHKLRLSQDTGNTLNSTGHAVIRALLNWGDAKELLQIIDDRLNYGIFLDDYTANILMDKFWKSKDFAAGSVIASQIMLQEDFKHPLTINLALLHCYNYLTAPGEWPQAPTPPEPEEEVKVRVKYLRNPYNDEHFDLREHQRIIGKTLAMACKGRTDPVHHSLRVLGLTLFGKEEAAKAETDSSKLVKEVMDLLPEKQDLDFISQDVQKFLQEQVSAAVTKTSEKDIANQCNLFKQWENERIQALEEQKKRLLTAQRLAEVEKLQQSLKDKEQKLWFFEREEDIELAIEEGAAVETTKKTQQVQKVEEEYVPPEVTKRHL